jgi:hypothetical protein
MDNVEALQAIDEVKKDYIKVFKTEAGERVLENLKEATQYHRPCMHKEQHLFIQVIALGKIIDHIYTMLEQPKEVILNLLTGE